MNTIFTASSVVESLCADLASFAEAVIAEQERVAAVDYAQSIIAAWYNVSSNRRMMTIRQSMLDKASELLKLYA